MTGAASQAADWREIVDVVERYFHGLHSGDTALLRSVFHLRAELFGEVNNAPYHRDLETYLSAVANRASPASRGEPFRMALHALERRGPIARATVSCPMLGFDYVDFLNLVKTGDGWLITNKTFTHSPAAETA